MLNYKSISSEDVLQTLKQNKANFKQRKKIEILSIWPTGYRVLIATFQLEGGVIIFQSVGRSEEQPKEWIFGYLNIKDVF